MRAANYIKTKHRKVRCCLNVWDFPDMMNDSNLRGLKRILKSGNNTRTYSLLKGFDLFFYLCEGMKEKVENVAPNRPYIVHEGIISEEQLGQYGHSRTRDNKSFKIVYTGKLTKKDGILDLILAVQQIDRQDVELEIAGGGEIHDEMMQLIERDRRIHYHGVLERDETLKLQKQADCFVVPRLAEDYTGYSFPSKVVEYILTGKPILTHKLKCFGEHLNGVLRYIPEDGNERLKDLIIDMINGDITPDENKRKWFIENNMNINIDREIINALSA